MSTLAAPAQRPGRVGTDVAVGLRIHTHAALTPAWITDAVLPAWDSVADGGRRLVTLRRGWLGGPHVEVTSAGPGSEDVAWSALAAAVAAGPAPATALDAETYLDQARERGRLEDVRPPYLPLHPHGAVRLVRRSEVLREDHPLDGLRSVVTGALAPAVVGTLRTIAADAGTQPTAVVQVLTQIAGAHTMGPGYGTFSLRSHAEALLAWLSPRTDLRPAFEQRYAAQRAAIVAEVGAILDGRAGSVPATWGTAIAYSRGIVDETVRRGELDGGDIDTLGRREQGREGPPGAESVAPTGDQPDTEFHNTVYGSGVTDGAGAWFAGYRFLVNCIYAQLPLLDVSPLQRAYGCWAVSEAVDEVLGQSWVDRLAATAPAARPSTEITEIADQTTTAHPNHTTGGGTHD